MGLTFTEYCASQQQRQVICIIRICGEGVSPELLERFAKIHQCRTVRRVGCDQLVLASEEECAVDDFLRKVQMVVSCLPDGANIEETRYGALDEEISVKKLALSRRFFVSPYEDARRVSVEPDTIYLEHGGVFGSGHHPSTRLAVHALEECCDEAPFTKVLDVGCGSGILSFVCLRLGACSVVGVDISSEAVLLAQKNSEHNGVMNQVFFSCTPLDKLEEEVDLLVANISPSVLQGLIPDFARLLLPLGRVILAGLHSGQVADIVRLMEGIAFRRHKSYGDGSWRSLVFEREC